MGLNGNPIHKTVVRLGLAAFAMVSAPLPAAMAEDAPRRIAVTSMAILKDPHTAVAINGYDAVSYFIDDAPQRGDAKYEVTWRGAVWRFENQGNRDVFAANPEVYAPAFGGYGAMAVARGFVAPSFPTLWAIRDTRLYLFFSTGNRHAWLTDPDKHVEQGEDNWTRIGDELVK